MNFDTDLIILLLGLLLPSSSSVSVSSCTINGTAFKDFVSVTVPAALYILVVVLYVLAVVDPVPAKSSYFTVPPPGIDAVAFTKCKQAFLTAIDKSYVLSSKEITFGLVGSILIFPC